MGGPGRLVILVLLSISGMTWSEGAPLNPFPLGTIGCLVSDVCDTGEICTNDLLFGTCQSQISRILNGEIKMTLNTDEVKHLEVEIKSLLKSGFTWKDAFTQCAIQNTLVEFSYGRRFDRYLCEDALGVASPDWSNEVKDEVAGVLLNLLNAGDLSTGDLSLSERVNDAYPSGQTDLDVLNSNKRDEIVQVHKYYDKSKGLLKRDPLFVGGSSSYGMLYPDTKPSSLYFDSKDDSGLYGAPSKEDVGYGESGTPYGPMDPLEELLQNQLLARYMKDLSTADRQGQSAALESVMGTSGTKASDRDEGNILSDDVLDRLVLSEDDQIALEGLASGTLYREDLEPGQLSRLRQFFQTLIQILQEEKEELYPQEDGEEDSEGLELEESPVDSGVAMPYPEDEVESNIDGREMEFPEGFEEESDNMGNAVLGDGFSGSPEVAMLNEDMYPDEAPAREDLLAGAGEVLEDGVMEEPGPAGDGEVLEEVLQTGEMPMDKKMSMDEEKHIEESLEPFDRNTMYLTLSKQLTEDEAELFVQNITKFLDLPKNMIQFRLPFPDNNIMLKVEDDPEGVWNNLAIGKASMAVNQALQNATGVTVLKYGPGEPPIMRLQGGPVASKQNNRYVVLTFILVGTIAGVVLAVVTIYLIKRHHRSKQKLANLTGNDGNEASKDYQDLCRQRMQGKSNEKPEPLHAASRIGSVSESQVRSPSSRSSTSSWSEEPAATNMDISTGHIVLSYMEDHLRNQDRLDKEWEAVSGYVADPASTKIAADPCNTRKNRFADILPYDHSRVILSSGANVANSDFINASFITDHDPRNPAYICTQGPLPHTVADFWQMIWEQGSVVIVMLTKLTENGTSLCHRYWPEEGSDLYHIYEVHLVSEHIWCDDYLVRSFYLKNLQTNETRTVTQFHFLTWPQLSVPASIKALLDFRRKVNKSFRGRSCPIVVHCSDGCGRSGTYCLIDMVLNKMAKGAKEIDMAATLEHIRDQRMSMVTTKEQFQFSLAAVAEEVHAILKALPQ